MNTVHSCTILEQLLIDRFDYGGSAGQVTIHFHPTGLDSLLTDTLPTTVKAHVCQDRNVPFETQSKGPRAITTESLSPALPVGRTPRISKLMSLAHHFERLVETGVVKDYAELARLGMVSRVRISQIMNLLLVAPDIQEAILFLPMVVAGHDPVKLKHLQPICLEIEWGRQRERWNRVHSEFGVKLVCLDGSIL